MLMTGFASHMGMSVEGLFHILDVVGGISVVVVRHHVCGDETHSSPRRRERRESPRRNQPLSPHDAMLCRVPTEAQACGQDTQ